MNIIALLLPFGQSLPVDTVDLNPSTNRFELELHSDAPHACCPRCQRPSQRVHSYYWRTLADVAWAVFGVMLRLRMRKFRCPHDDCAQQVFCERLPAAVAAVYARTTDRLVEQLRQIGLLLGGAPGARLSRQLHCPVSATTLLRLIRTALAPAPATPKVLGVDDFATRKGQDYGTVLIDLERHKPIELLPDREADTLAAWLDAHPGVEIIARDRASAYADGARRGAPQALQVADRFHLIRNLAEVLLSVFEAHQQALAASQVATSLADAPPALVDPVVEPAESSVDGQPADSSTVTVPPPSRGPIATARREQRVADYERAKQLDREGWTISAMAQYLGLNRKTVRRYVHAEMFPDKRRPASRLDPYKPYLLERWNAGCRTGTVLLAEIQAQGYRGKDTIVFDYLCRLRQAQGLPPRSRAFLPAVDPTVSVLTPREAVWLVVRRPDRWDDDDKTKLDQLHAAHPAIATAIDLTQTFLQRLRQRQGEYLDDWLEQAAASGLVPFQRFVKSLRSDYDAVKAAFTLPWSTGPVEGHINRLKLLKRQMFGRAKLDLLEKRFVLAA